MNYAEWGNQILEIVQVAHINYLINIGKAYK